jgi:hypothetical protein
MYLVGLHMALNKDAVRHKAGRHFRYLDYLAEKAAQQVLSFIKIFPFDKLIIVENG